MELGECPSILNGVDLHAFHSSMISMSGKANRHDHISSPSLERVDSLDLVIRPRRNRGGACDLRRRCNRI